MDIRKPVLGILVGGSPAPGVNGVICSVTLEAINKGCETIEWWASMKDIKDYVKVRAKRFPSKFKMSREYRQKVDLFFVQVKCS